ncbi:pyridoxal-phosphate dependent enzyme [Maribius pontilimi]|uniref:Pyridoxal-phosphate dependent enzyme n=1 Tax=Palleronia pontilimi TaxID=1964209 RepID=A0A934II14_9RHOB|nr:pyridoxal-phosphate dependent enzyme [Palleronia pontilimi]MBJ3763303.1 pyridoxal-phosphate dependent enzyme [Palleronia pontilimi]
MEILENPFRGYGLDHPDLGDMPWPSVDAARAAALTRRCPRHAETRLRCSPALASRIGIGALHLKDERDRMGLGSFKALGAAYVIAQHAQGGQAKGRTYVTASAGNHGLSVAAGAQAFGAHAVIYLADTVPEAFADRLRGLGAQVVRAGAVYEQSMEAAAEAATASGDTLLSDSSWPGYAELPHLLMEGYLVMMSEAIDQMPAPPSHIFLQAGVGGLAASTATLARAAWGDTPRVIVVEPDAAPALHGSIAAGEPTQSQGPASAMGRLDCKMPSLIALKGLARDADAFALISEAECANAAYTAAEQSLPTTPSGAAGLAGALAMDPDPGARVLCILSEGPE